MAMCGYLKSNLKENQICIQFCSALSRIFIVKFETKSVRESMRQLVTSPRVLESTVAVHVLYTVLETEPCKLLFTKVITIIQVV